MSIKTRKPGELVFNMLLVLVSLFLVYESYQISGFGELSSPGIFPLLASFTMLVAAMFSLFSCIQLPAPSHPMTMFMTHILPRPVIIMLFCVMLFALILEGAGFLVSSFLFLFTCLNLFYQRGWKISAVIALAALSVVYAVFRGVFLVVLPEGEWLESLGWSSW
jgi:putative tricarboxylic transport membrane protein